MKKLLFPLMLFCAMSLSAQNATISNAILYHKDNELDKAKMEIDKAIVHEKTKSDPKAWYYKGVIYADISRSAKPEIKSLSPDPLKESYEALNTSMKLDVNKSETYKLSDSKLKEIWADIINKGILDYESEKLNESIVSFEMAQSIKPQDTTAYIYGSYAAEGLNDEVKLKKYTSELVKLNYRSPYVLRNMIYLESDPVKKLEIAKSAVAQFPNDVTVVEANGDTYAEQGKSKEALASYKKLNELVPGNVTVLTKLALQYEKLKEQEQALELYKKIIGLEPANFIANYNGAIIYFEKGKMENDKLHKLSMDEYHKSGKAMEDEVKKIFDTALSYAKVALTQTKEEADVTNINLMISEINKVTKK
jgi:tetratricopeptide (TPR) repeat protein